MTVLENLYYGNINPQNSKTPRSKDYLERENLISRLKEKLYKSLKQEDIDLIEQIEELHIQQRTEIGCSDFVKGFSLCFSMSKDVAKIDEELLN